MSFLAALVNLSHVHELIAFELFPRLRWRAAGLEAAGFKRLTERDSWSHGKLVENGKYYVTRNQSSIIAFTVPPKLDRSAVGMSIVGSVRLTIASGHVERLGHLAESCLAFAVVTLTRHDSSSSLCPNARKRVMQKLELKPVRSFDHCVAGRCVLILIHCLTDGGGLWHSWLDRDLGGLL